MSDPVKLVARPTRLPLKDTCAAECAVLTTRRWDEVVQALRSPVFNPLVAHFLVRAFTSDEIDEFVAHIIVVEAALGMQSDFKSGVRPKIPGPKQGATERVARRTAAITG